MPTILENSVRREMTPEEEAEWLADQTPPAPPGPTLKERLDALDAKFDELVPQDLRGSFAPVWAAVRASLQADKPDLALAAVEATEVPPELEAAKSEFIAMLGG